MGDFHFYIFNPLFVLLATGLSVLSCLAVIPLSNQIRTANNPRAMFFFCSFILALLFSSTHYFIAQSLKISAPEQVNGVYLLAIILFSYGASLVVLSTSLGHRFWEMNYVTGSTMIALCLIGADYVGYSLFFNGYLDVQWILVLFTVLLTLSAAFPIYRFLLQLAHADERAIPLTWRIVGGVLSGVSLVSIPYIVLMSIVRIPNDANFSLFELFLPYLLTISANMLMTLVPSFISQSMLEIHSESYNSLFHDNPIAVFAVNPKGEIMSINEQACDLLGKEREDVQGQSIFDFLIMNDASVAEDQLSKALSGELHQMMARMKYGTSGSRAVKITVIRTVVGGQIQGLFGIVEDISEKIIAEERVRHLAFHDDLTGLPNRRAGNRFITRMLQEKEPFSILMVDFDRFKRVNDTFGHSFGDECLVSISKRLKRLVQNPSTVYRLGGDEFLIILPDHEAEWLAHQLVSTFNEPLLIDGYDILMTASIGIAKYPTHATNAEDLLKFADIAMYTAKENGANGFFEYHVTESSTTTADKVTIETELRQALASNDLFLVYQPKFEALTSEMAGAEALLRWEHRERRFIPPGVFIPIAEECGMIVDVERYVFREVCRQLAIWNETGFDPGCISINVSLVSLLKEDFMNFVMETMKEFGIEGTQLEFEITERIVMKNEEYVNLMLQKMRDIGIQISIDDFGTGYSSLNYLHKLHVDSLKIDKSFIDQIEENRAVVSAIISIAHSLRLKTVAEGVETLIQLEMLQELACDEIQGYVFSPPLPVEAFEEFVRKEVSLGYQVM